MGVSVSASTAIIVAGLFFAFTAFYPVAANGFDRVTDAQQGIQERSLERQNTDFAVTNATYDGTNELVVNATNDGSVGLVATDATLVVGNEYVDVGGANATTTVDGDADTELWLGGETLTVTVNTTTVDTAITTGSDPTRVVLVVESGVRDTAEVSA